MNTSLKYFVHVLLENLGNVYLCYAFDEFMSQKLGYGALSFFSKLKIKYKNDVKLACMALLKLHIFIVFRLKG